MLNMYLLRIVKYRKKPKLKDQFERKKYNLIFYDAHMSNLRIQWLVTNTYITSTNDVFGSHIIRQIINRIRRKPTSIVNYLLYLIYVAITKEGIIDSDHNKNDAWIELHDFFTTFECILKAFPCVSGAAYGLIQHRGKLFSFNTSNAILQFLLEVSLQLYLCHLFEDSKNW